MLEGKDLVGALQEVSWWWVYRWGIFGEPQWGEEVLGLHRACHLPGAKAAGSMLLIP